MNYKDAIAYLYEALPMFTREGASAYQPGLQKIKEICSILGHPQSKFKSIHVAGTNGKGSSSHMLASILQSAGYKTGLYTSPHLKKFNERIRVNGESISDDDLAQFVSTYFDCIQNTKPSFFEITTAMAFDYFAQKEVDIAVIEVGLGGRLDATNIIEPEVCLITNIGWDHMDILGDTLEKIAFEKGGIIKSGIPVVISEKQTEVLHVFETITKERNCILYDAETFTITPSKPTIYPQIFEVKKEGKVLFDHLICPLNGIYQSKNIKGVLKTVDILVEKGYAIEKEHIETGIHQVIEQTHLKGRWQKIAEKPTIVCDTAHNLNGIEEILKQIESQVKNQLWMILGFVKDKDIDLILQKLPKNANFVFCAAKIPRAMNALELNRLAEKYQLNGIHITDVNEAIRYVLNKASEDDLIYVGGSTFVVAEIENL